MNKLFTSIAAVSLGLTMAIGVGTAVGTSVSKEAVEAKAADGDSPVILDASSLDLSSTATSSEVSKTYGGVTYKVSKGAKSQSSSGSNRLSSNGAILIGKSGAYIYNSTPLPGSITKFEVFANSSASAKVSVGVKFATTAITTWSATGAWSQTLSTVNKVYDASSAIVSGATYFRYQVTNANNSQVQLKITYSAAVTYTVSFDGNGATGSMSPVTNVFGSYTLPANGFDIPTGKAFAGWKAENTGNTIAAGSSYTVNANVKFYAQWADAYKVTYTAGTNGTGSFEHNDQPAGSYTLLPFANLTGVSANSGYAFDNYTVNGVAKNPGDTITLNSATEVTVNFKVKPEETTYDFTTNFTTYASNWATSYGTHEGLDGKTDIGGDYEATIDMYYASKQTGTSSITNMPVFASKTGSGSWAKILQFTLNETGYKIDSVVVTFAQWGSKTPDIALFKGTEASGTPLNTATIGSSNTVETSNLNGTIFTIGYCDKNTSSNVQSGVKSIYISIEKVSSFGTLDHITIVSLPNVVYHVGETYSSTGLSVIAYDGADESTANFKDVTSLVETDLDNPTPFVDGDVPGFDCDVQYTGDGGSDSDSFHVYVYALAEYELVTTELTDWSGSFLIVGTNSESNLCAMNGGLSNPDVEQGYKVVTDNDGVIQAGQELEWTIESVSGGYSILGKSGKYIGSLTAKSNGLLVSDSPVTNTFSISGSDVSVTGTNTYSLTLNATGDRFRYYSSGTVKLYKLKESSAASDYADLFLSTLKGGENPICTAYGQTDIDDLKEAWATLFERYNSDLLPADKEQFRIGAGSENPEATNIAQAIYLYDWIASHYTTRLESETCTDYNFMGRSVTSAGRPNTIFESSTDNIIPIIVIVSLISVSAIGGYFYTRRRKEHN